MEIFEDGTYRLRAVVQTERHVGGLLNLYVDDRLLRQAPQSTGFASVELEVSPPPQKLRAGQYVTATLNGEPIPPENLTVERLGP